MAAEQIFGNTMTLEIEVEGGTPIPVGVLRGFEARFECEEVPLYGGGSIKRQNTARHSLKVPFKASAVSLDVALIGEVMGDWDPITGTAKVADTEIMTRFTARGQVVATNGTTRQATVSGITFPTFPVLPAEMDTWVQYDIEGTGDDVELTTTPV